MKLGIGGAALLALSIAGSTQAVAQEVSASDLAKIETIVILYAENRSFDALYGAFPGANGLADVTPQMALQRDRDGSVLKELPPIWGGLTAKGLEPKIDQAHTAGLPNAPFAIDDPKGFDLPLGVATRDLWHKFYQNQMQIDGGKNDRFVAWGDSGALVMGHYDGSKLPLWPVAKRYTLADNFFMGGFGGSLKNIGIGCASGQVGKLLAEPWRAAAMVEAAAGVLSARYLQGVVAPAVWALVVDDLGRAEVSLS